MVKEKMTKEKMTAVKEKMTEEFIDGCFRAGLSIEEVMSIGHYFSNAVLIYLDKKLNNLLGF